MVGADRSRPGDVGFWLNIFNFGVKNEVRIVLFWGGAERVGMGGLCWGFVGASDSKYGTAINPCFLGFFNPPKLLQISK